MVPSNPRSNVSWPTAAVPSVDVKVAEDPLGRGLLAPQAVMRMVQVSSSTMSDVSVKVTLRSSMTPLKLTVCGSDDVKNSDSLEYEVGVTSPTPQRVML